MTKSTSKVSEDVQSEIMEKAKALEEKYQTRNLLFGEMEDVYFMKGTDLPDGDHVRETIAPDGRNAIQTALRLITATDPQWDVPDEYNTLDVKAVASNIENLCASIWYAAGATRRKPIHYSATLSALLYSEIHIMVALTKDLHDTALPEHQARYKRLMEITPLIFTVANPKTGFPEYDDTGLIAYNSKLDKTVAQLRSEFGESVETLLEGRKFTDKLVLNTYWDSLYKMIWLEEYPDEPLMAVEHGLDYIPISATLVEGDEFFVEDDQDTRQPFLYALHKSGFLNRLSLAYTSMYTSMFSVAANPTFIYMRNHPEKELLVDYSYPGGVAYLDPGERLEPMVKNAVDPSIIEGLRIAEEKLAESTVYKTIGGEPIGANSPFSMVALLHQAGRLPLIPYQRMTNIAIADSMKIGLSLLKSSGGNKISAMGEEGKSEFNLKELPESYQLTAYLDINLPQDEAQNVQMATQATFGEKPLVSKEYARKRWFKIKQPDQEQEKIWAEELADAKNMIEVQNELMQAQQEAMGGGMAGPLGGGQAPAEALDVGANTNGGVRATPVDGNPNTPNINSPAVTGMLPGEESLKNG
jgi:hypothetical protein